MKNSRASERYAKSLLQLSIDKDLVEEIKSDIDILIIIFSESREVSNLYLSPIIPISHEVEITNKIFSKKINENTLNLILNVIYRKRDNLIQSILSKFIELYNVHNNIEESFITTTCDLDDETFNDIKKFAEKVSKKKVSLSHNQNKKIIGGFNLKIGDKMMDCTVSSRINDLRKKLINN